MAGWPIVLDVVQVRDVLYGQTPQSQILDHLVQTSGPGPSHVHI